ncbi:IS3 family transposase [Nonomuraea fuscirosea]|uniref:IS3 family transposase n=1 Tax=Nonomuraea fuscirosea TaxID=1291556 RepID=UPI00342AEB18
MNHDALRNWIDEIREMFGFAYGADRVHRQLRRDGIRVGRQRVERLIAGQDRRGGAARQDPQQRPCIRHLHTSFRFSQRLQDNGNPAVHGFRGVGTAVRRHCGRRAAGGGRIVRVRAVNLADRGFFSMDRRIRASATGAHLVWRVKNGAKSLPARLVEFTVTSRDRSGRPVTTSRPRGQTPELAAPSKRGSPHHNGASRRT